MTKTPLTLTRGTVAPHVPLRFCDSEPAKGISVAVAVTVDGRVTATTRGPRLVVRRSPVLVILLTKVGPASAVGRITILPPVQELDDEADADPRPTWGKMAVATAVLDADAAPAPCRVTFPDAEDEECALALPAPAVWIVARVTTAVDWAIAPPAPEV